jgi:hypothetical protein
MPSKLDAAFPAALRKPSVVDHGRSLKDETPQRAPRRVVVLRRLAAPPAREITEREEDDDDDDDDPQDSAEDAPPFDDTRSFRPRTLTSGRQARRPQCGVKPETLIVTAQGPFGTRLCGASAS